MKSRKPVLRVGAVIAALLLTVNVQQARADDSRYNAFVDPFTNICIECSWLTSGQWALCPCSIGGMS